MNAGAGGQVERERESASETGKRMKRGESIRLHVTEGAVSVCAKNALHLTLDLLPCA